MPLSRFFSTDPKTTAAKRERRKDARPGELLAAALDLFVEKGFAGTRAEEVAQRAGVSKGTLFLYFASKEDLFRAVVRDSFSNHYPAWHAELDAFTGSTADMLHLCLQSWWARVGSSKSCGISKLMMSEGANFPDLMAFYQQEVVAPGHALIRRILQRGIDRGEFRAVDMTHATYSVVAPMVFLVMWNHALGKTDTGNPPLVPEEFLTAQVDIMLRGLCVTAPTDSRSTTHSNSKTKESLAS